MPFLLSGDRSKLVGHFAKQNPQHAELENQEVLVTLQGPHGYISPSWYESFGVRTWNYQAVHIYGVCTLFDSHKKLKELVDSLTDNYESFFPAPWQPEYKALMLDVIIGVEITINNIQCKYKLSQNRSAQEKEQIAEQLENMGSHELARAMLRNE